MQIIAVVDKNWGIGQNGQQMVTIPMDQSMFRLETQGKVIVMGRRTLQALPGARPLDNRINLILTKDEKLQAKGAVLCGSMEEVLLKLEEYKEKGLCRDEDVSIIGGQSIYEQFLPYCDKALITYVDYEYQVDTYMVDLEKEGWKLVETSEEQTYFDLCYEFRTYVRPKKG